MENLLSGIRMIIIALGLAGNLISFLLFSRPTFKSNSISNYSRALAIFDSYTSFQLTIDVGLVFFGTHLPSISQHSCQIYTFISVSLSAIPGWILVVFAIDKLASMHKWPLSRFLRHKRHQYAIIAAIVTIHLVLYSEILVMARLHHGVCNTMIMPLGYVLTPLYLVEASVIPVSLMLVSSVLIIKKIRESARTVVALNYALDVKRRSRDFKFALTSLSFNVLYIALRLPLVICFVLVANGFDVPVKVLDAASIMFYTNSSINILVHGVSNSIFRREVLIVLGLRNPRSV